MEYPYTNQLLYIKRSVINVLLRNSNSDPFKIPVNPEVLHVPQYPKLIKCPMDFGTIKMKLDKQIYQTANECKSDFLDVFRNCYIFNEPGSLYVEMALKLENLFKRKMADLPVPEHYVPESTFHTPKSNKVKKGKSINIHNTSLGGTGSVKPKIPVSTPANFLNQTSKSDITINSKRKRSETNNGFIKEEPQLKKSKLDIDIKLCKNIIVNLMSKKYNDLNRYFLEPVDVEGLKLHDYYDIVKKPMDLGTVKSKLLENCYQTNEDFADDVKLVFKNCYLYNPEGHEVHRCGKLLDEVFVKLFNSAFSNSKKSVPQHTRIPPSYDFQPLLQKILKRQSEIDSLHEYIIKRNREIQQSIDFINSTELIKSFKASINLNHKPTNFIVKKPPTNSFNHEPKPEKAFSPKPTVTKSKPDVKSEASSHKFSSSVINTPQKPIETSKSPKIISPKQEIVRDTPNRFSETKKVTKPVVKSQINNANDETLPLNSKKPMNHINNNLVTDNTPNSSDSINSHKSQPKPVNQVEESKPIKNKEAFTAHLKEIKTWIGSLSTEMAMRVRDFINKSENKNVVSVSLQKLKPITISGLHKMMVEAKSNQQQINDQKSNNLKEFTIEDRMQLSQDLRLLGEKCSAKILNIYKKTEDVQSSDGECEIDFQTMKLITLHNLREFADKCLQKQLKKGAVTADQSVGNNEGDSDSDSSDLSDSDASDSNSDASSSTSDNEFFNNLPKNLIPLDSNSQSTSFTTNAQSKNGPELPSKSIKESISVEVLQSISQDKHHISSSHEESRLSDSSDSDKDKNEDDIMDCTPKRPIYTALWNKSTNDNKPANTLASKPKRLSIPHPMRNNSANNQLTESLRQIAQDAQASENIKKQEEELRLVRKKQEEEQKIQQNLKTQALHESRKQLHHSEIQKKEEDLLRLKELAINDQKQRTLDIPCILEREDYHQILCDFEYNIDQETIMKLVHLDSKQFHL